MDIKFLGAAKEVTGSSYLVTTEHSRFLVDCGLFQGENADAKNEAAFAFDVDEIDFVILTHAHVDHSGRLPKLVKEGYHGPIFATFATTALSEIMLLDSAKIQENDVEWQNRKRIRAGEDLIEPLYTTKDAEKAIAQMKPLHYYTKEKLSDDVTLRFKDAGHILGSAILELWVTEGEKEVKVVFSGDLGMPNRPIVRDPDMGISADVLILESTYGNTVHEPYKESAKKLVAIAEEVTKNNGTVVIPSFAVGRTQELIYELNLYFKDHPEAQKIPIFIDSPLAVEATKVFAKNASNFDEQASALVMQGTNPFEFANLTYVESVEESRALNTNRCGRIIISSSGMATAGRVRHHLKHNLWDENSAVVLVGYQAKGTLGRLLLEGIERVKLFGEDIAVNAKVYSLPGFSAHADEPMLLSFVESMPRKPKEIYLVHGEEDEQNVLKKMIERKWGIPTKIAEPEESVSIVAETKRREKINDAEMKELEELYDRVNEGAENLKTWKQDLLRTDGLEDRYQTIYSSLLQIRRAIMDMGMKMGKNDEN